MLHITIQLRNGPLLHRIREDYTSKDVFLKTFGQFIKHSFIEPFPLSNLLQMLNNHKVADIEFFSSLRESTSMMALNWLLSTSNGRSLHPSSSRLSSPLQNFLNHPCTVIHQQFLGQFFQCIADVVSCLCCSKTHFELEKGNRSDLLIV